jgi:hypothetical protein
MTSKSSKNASINNIESISKCYDACKVTYQEMQIKSIAQLQEILDKHMDSLQRIGGNDVIVAFNRKKIVGIIKAINNVFKNKETSTIMLLILTDYVNLYQKNQAVLENIMKCFVKNCDVVALDIMKELFELFINMLKLQGDKKIKKQLDRLNSLSVKNLTRLHSNLS